MSTATITAFAPALEESPQWMTTEELLALPEDDATERWLLRGRLIERPRTWHNFTHCRTEAKIAYVLNNWLAQQPEPRGLVVSGEAGFRLSRHPDFTVGIDVAYLSAEQMAATAKRASLIEGPPVLAVEILSPSDRVDGLGEKIDGYLQAGVKLAWRVEPVFGLITVFRPDAEPEGLNVNDDLDGGPRLPGFRVSVIFA